MAPLAGHAVAALDQPAVDHQTPAAAGAEDDGEDHRAVRARAVHGFGQGHAVGVVGHAHGTLQPPLQIVMQRKAVQPDAVGVAHQARHRRDRAGHADPDAREALARLRLDRLHERGDGFEQGVVGAGIGPTDSGDDLAVGSDGRGLDLGAAEVDSETQGR